MVPRYQVMIDPSIPMATTYWTPSAEELEEDGAPGDFHDTELIKTDVDEARAIIDAEREAIAYIDAHSTTEYEFDELAADIEFEMPDVPSDEAPAFLHETAWYGVNGLEIGVAGLVYALNAVGVVTAASCRSHHQSYAPWSDYPLVVFAANRGQAEALQPLVAAAGCGFEIDDVNRPQLLAIVAPSLLEMTTLAQSVLDTGEAFAGLRRLK